MNRFLRGRLGPTFVILFGVSALVWAQQPVSQSGTWTITATDLDVQSGGADILSTTAFNAAFGTAGTADTQVLSIQGIASMTAVQVTPSTAATWGIYAEDSAHSSTHAGLQVFGVRQDSQVDFGADGDYVPFSINDAGELRVAFSGAAGGTSLADDGDVTAGTTPFTLSGGFYQSSVTACTDGDGCTVGLTAQRAFKVTLFNTSGAELTPAQDWTASSAIGTTAPGVMMEAKDFDGSALPLTASAAEGDAIPQAASLYGIAYSYLVNEDGSKSALVDEDVASAGADLLLKIAGIRDDTLDARSTTEGDYEMFHMNANGALWTIDVNSAAMLTALQLIDNTIFADDAAFTIGTSNVTVAGFVVDEASTDSADEGDTAAARVTPDRRQYVVPSAHSIGGADSFKRTSAGSTEDEHEIKSSAGTLYSVTATNTNAAVRYIRCANNTAAGTTPGSTTPIIDLAVPGATTGAGITFPFPVGLSFSTGLTCWLVTGAADTDVAEVAANELKVLYTYK